MRALENNIRIRLQNDYTSVRKAFLDLDLDRDGFIEPTEIIRLYGHSFDIQYDLLEAIFQRNCLSGKIQESKTSINYSDFSRWLGPAIHQAEGFIFRHDSKKNPVYETWLKQEEQRKGADKLAAAQSLWTEDTVLEQLITKIRQYWKTTTKCFRDFNENNDISIEKDELKFYLHHWGFPLTDAQIEKVFNYLDHDGDEAITFQDFVHSIGHEIHPGESLYFRQDKQLHFVDSKCAHRSCWAMTKGQANFCLVHLKMYQAKVDSLFTRIYERLSKASLWEDFVRHLARQVDTDDHFSIQIERFIDALLKFKIKLSAAQRMMLCQTVPAPSLGDARRDLINIRSLYLTEKD